jgi:hypothetical protein
MRSLKSLKSENVKDARYFVPLFGQARLGGVNIDSLHDDASGVSKNFVNNVSMLGELINRLPEEQIDAEEPVDVSNQITEILELSDEIYLELSAMLGQDSGNFHFRKK